MRLEEVNIFDRKVSASPESERIIGAFRDEATAPAQPIPASATPTPATKTDLPIHGSGAQA